MGCWCAFTQRFLIEMPPKRGDFQCTVCWISMSWTAQWSDWLMIPLSQWVAPWNSKDMTILGRSPPLTTSQSGKQIGLVFRSHDIYIYSDMTCICDIMWYYCFMIPYIWCPLYFCMISWFYTVFSQGWRRPLGIGWNLWLRQVARGYLCLEESVSWPQDASWKLGCMGTVQWVPFVSQFGP